MKSIRIALVMMIAVFSFHAHAQVTSIPEQAKENFFKQYPDAKNVKWDNDLISVNASFEQDSSKLNAEYNNKGIWKKTLKDWTFEKLATDIQDGFKKSKYAGKQVLDVKVLYLPGYVIQYRIRVEKNNIERTFLYFNTDGRLVRTNVAI